MAHRHLISELVSWIATAAMLCVFAYNFQNIRKALGFALPNQAGLSSPVNRAQSVTARESDEPRSLEGVELHADRSGHFATAIEANGRSLQAMVDTGATIVMLTYEDAERAGIFLRDQDFTMRMQTANGIARAAPVTLDRLSVGSITIHNVQAGVGEPGLLRTNLLGMSFLKRLSKFEIRSGTLVLQE